MAIHACYMILHAFTIYSMQLQALHANPVGPYLFKKVGSLPFVLYYLQLQCFVIVGNTCNTL